MDDTLQFDRAELAVAAACGACAAPLRDSYFQVAGQPLCGGCAEQTRQVLTGTGSHGGRLLRAALLGLGAGILSAAIYYGVLALTGYNVGLVAIVVGVLVGRAVRKGSGGRGGLAYQFLAAGITYLAIASTFLPMAISEMRNAAISDTAAAVTNTAMAGESIAVPTEAMALVATTPAPDHAAAETAPMNPVLAVLALLALTLSLPILVAFGGGVVALLIVGFGVWEAWRVNKRLVLDMTGPHAIVAQPPALPPALAQA